MEQLDLGPMPSPPKGRPRLYLRRTVEASIEAAPWITDMDRAACQLAVTLATRMDRETDQSAWNKAAPLLLSALGELGLTPKVRKAMTGSVNDPVDDLIASLGTSPVRDEP